MITIYNGLSDEELLRKLNERDRSASPLLQELCNRLEARIDRDNGASMGLGMRTGCPVCEAPLLADFDIDNDVFNLKVNKP